MAKKKKRRPAASPAKPAAAKKAQPRPAARKRPPRAVSPAARRKKAGAGLRTEMMLSEWSRRVGISDYSGREWGRLALLAIGLCVILYYSFSAGGYFVIRRSYGELMILWLLVVGLLFDLQMRGRMPRLGQIELGLFGGYTAWMLLSVSWSIIPARSEDEFVRGLLYLAGFALFYLYLSRREWLGWLGHLFIAIVVIVCFDALLGKTFPDVLAHPDPFMSNRLNYPLTYWNTMAVFMTMAFIIGLRVLADKTTNVIVRMLYAPAMFVFLVVLVFTFSRAGFLLLAGAIGLYVFLATARLRAVMQTAVLSLWTAAVVLISSRFLPNMLASVPDEQLKVSEGHKLALVIILFMAVAAASQYLIRRYEDRVQISQQQGRTIGYGIAGGLGALLVVAVLVFTFTGGRGGPVKFISDQVGGLSEAERGEAVERPSERLFSLRSERFQEYGVSLKVLKESPLQGTGAGTWSVAWFQYRPWDIQVKDGHSWFFETIAELGLVGTLLLAGFVVMFFVVSIRDLRFLKAGRDRELYGAFFVACTVFLVHSMIDWDWEMPVITLAFFMFAGGLLRFGQLARVEAGEEEAYMEGPPRSGWRRFLGWNWLLGAGCVLAMAATIIPLVAATRIQSANQLASQQNFAAMEKEAKTAQILSPFDAEPYVLEALAKQSQGKLDEAEQLLLKAADKEPRNDKTYRNLTRIYLQLAEAARTRGDNAAFLMYAEKARDAIVKSRQLNTLESKETGDLESQVRNLLGAASIPQAPAPGN